MYIFQRQQNCIRVTTLHSYYMKNGLVFSQSDARNFFITFSYTQIESEISDQVTNEYTPTRQIVTGKANERFVSMPSAKKQRKHSTTSRVSPFVLQLLAAALQQNEASLFVNVTHLILKGGDSRLKLLSFEIFVVPGQIEANFHYFTSYPHCSSEKWNTSDDEVKNISLLFLISDDPFFLETNDWRQILCRRHLTEHSMRINVCSLECDLTKHYPSS